MIIKKLPKRRPDTHKGDYGRLFFLAGSDGMLGAGVLCSRAALRSGAGLVYLGTTRAARDLVNLATPEVIVVGGDGVKDYLPVAQQADAIGIGPGLGERRAQAKELLLELARRKFSGAVVLDADGLAACSDDPALFSELGLNLILTPHPGEFARLTADNVTAIQQARAAKASAAARKWRAIVVLKGQGTVVADALGNTYINKTGNPGMATAGSGDVLTGLITALCGQGLPAWDAAVGGVKLHGLAGDLAAKDKGEYGLIASDIIDRLPYAIQKSH